MSRLSEVEAILRSRRVLLGRPPEVSPRKAEAEGGCGVIGIAASEPIAGRHLLQALDQMRNRGNGKGGGVAMVGLDPDILGADAEVLRHCYALTIAYLVDGARADVEKQYVEPLFNIRHVHEFQPQPVRGLEIPAPRAVTYMVEPRAAALEVFQGETGLMGVEAASDELVYQNSYRLNRTYYSSLGEKRAFVLSHGKDMLVLKLVGFGDDVVRAYGLEEARAHVWIGHHRYPTKGRVWHPGGAHPFVGLHEALVHNGDFANYASVCTYLAQRNIEPLFLTDTEVSVLVFDLLHRTYGYPLEYVMEALAPTTERDFHQLPPERRDIYERLQAAHIHGSPDGPWFFLIAQSAKGEGAAREARLIGITDTSMLRPQVFALQRGGDSGPDVGFAASEKQAIDAALESLAEGDGRYGRLPDRVWNARGGSHTDGGAFVFRVVRDGDGRGLLTCSDKFRQAVDVDSSVPPHPRNGAVGLRAVPDVDIDALFEGVSTRMATWDYDDLEAVVQGVVSQAQDDRRRSLALHGLSLLLDRRYPTGRLRPRSVREICLEGLEAVWERIRRSPSAGYVWSGQGLGLPRYGDHNQTLILDGRGIPPDGPASLARRLNDAVAAGFRRVMLVHTRGHRFLASGLGPDTAGVSIDVYGSPGDYLGSGLDGAEVTVHANGQDQLAQILKSGRLVVHGDVGQTFMYAAKGGRAFVQGNAAGRPLINAVGKPQVVINGTCLDYLAESFMAGDPLNGGGFVILNGITFSHGAICDLPEPYPGGNLFSLASGGAIFLRDPYRRVGPDQLNGGEFGVFGEEHWRCIQPLLEENERLLGVRIDDLLKVDGAPRSPFDVYRVIRPAGHAALMPEEAWVAHSGG